MALRLSGIKEEGLAQQDPCDSVRDVPANNLAMTRLNLLRYPEARKILLSPDQSSHIGLIALDRFKWAQQRHRADALVETAAGGPFRASLSRASASNLNRVNAGLPPPGARRMMRAKLTRGGRHMEKPLSASPSSPSRSGADIIGRCIGSGILD